MRPGQTQPEPVSAPGGNLVRPLAATAAIQAAAFAILYALPPGLASVGAATLPAAALAVSALAMVAASRIGAGSWVWTAVNAAMPLCGLTVVAFKVPATPFLVAALFALAIFGPAAAYRVPLYLSGRCAARALRLLMAARKAPLVADLGCGVGTILVEASRLKSSRVIGAEAALVPYLICRARLWLAGATNCEIRFGDLFAMDLRGVDIAYAFLSPAPMPRLIAKARREMPRGSLLVSNTFGSSADPPDRMIRLPDAKRSYLLVWIMPGGSLVRAPDRST